jgi:hypothetical protein
VAITSRAPHITERPVIDLSGSVSQYYEITSNAFDIAIAGLPFVFAITDSTPYRRQTAEFRTQRFDNGRDPGEQSLSGSGYWIRSQSSFHLGTGINYAEPLEGDTEQIKFRYKSSTGIDPWTAGQLSLLKNTSLQEPSTTKSQVFSTTIGADNFLIQVNNSASDTKRIIKISADGATETTIANNTAITEAILFSCMGGNDLMVVTATKVWRYSFDAASPALHQDYAINTANASVAAINYVKQRFILAYSDVSKNTFVYELARNTGSSINLSTLTAVNGSTTLPIGFTFTAVTESSNAIYVGGFSGDEGMALKITVDASGNLTTLTRVILLPKSEILTALYGYLGSYVMIGTNRGVRVGVVDTNGDITYGPLLFEDTGNIYAFAAANNFVWAGVDAGIGGQSGLIRINLGSPLTNGGYAYATDLVAASKTGHVHSVAIFADGRKAFTVESTGLYVEHATELVESGTIETGLIRFDTLENKAWKRIRVRHPETLQGDIQIARVKETVADALTTIASGNIEQYDYDLALVFADVSPDAAFRFNLYRNATTASTGAVMYGYSAKALPTPTRARVIQIPILLFDKETDKLGNIIGFDGYARQRLNALETVEGAGETVIIQDFSAGGEPIEAVIEQVTFTRTTPPKSGFTGYGGVAQVIARTVV